MRIYFYYCLSQSMPLRPMFNVVPVAQLHSFAHDIDLRGGHKLYPRSRIDVDSTSFRRISCRLTSELCRFLTERDQICGALRKGNLSTEESKWCQIAPVNNVSTWSKHPFEFPLAGVISHLYSSCSTLNVEVNYLLGCNLTPQNTPALGLQSGNSFRSK